VTQRVFMQAVRSLNDRDRSFASASIY
jgi:hypothetical protein